MSDILTSSEQHQDDDGGIEIIPLHQPVTRTSSDEKAATAASPAQSSSSRNLRFSGEKRRIFLQFAIACSAVIFVLLVILDSFPNLSTMALQALTKPFTTPMATPLLNINHFYVQTALPTTTVLLDGHPLHTPRIGIDAPLVLANGMHHITWSAFPFKAQRCQFSVPITPYVGNNSCLITPIENENQAVSPQASLIVLRESLATLPAQAQRALMNTIQKALVAQRSTTVIMPGELYASEYATSYTKATQPIVATQQFQPMFGLPLPICSIAGINGLDCNLSGQDCIQLCTVPWQPQLAQTTQLFAQGWLVLTYVRTLWNYTTEDGHIILKNQALDDFGHPILLSVTWNGLWHAKPFTGSALGQPVIIDGIQILDNPACSMAYVMVEGQISANASQLGFISGPNPANGCLVETILRRTAGMPSSPSLPMAYFLEQFGVLLADNQVASQMQPNLPLADAQESIAAQQLKRLPGQFISSP